MPRPTRQPSPEEREERERLERLAQLRAARLEESTEDRHLRFVRSGLDMSLRHLRPLRTTIPVTRDAIKLIRQVQNLLEDAEDDAS